MPGVGRKFCCEVFTPEGQCRACEALYVQVPASDGQLGVLGGRAPLVAKIGCGPMLIRPPAGKEEDYYVAGGFLQVREDALTVLAEEFVALKELAAEAAWDELEEARKLPTETDAQYRTAQQAIERARIKFRLAQKHRQKSRLAERRSMEDME